jgi:hypothetical protein
MIREVDLHDVPFPLPHPHHPSSSASLDSESIRFLSLPCSVLSLDLLEMAQGSPSSSSSCFSIPCVSSGELHGIALWYRIHLAPDSDCEDGTIDTGPISASSALGSRSSCRYWRQVVFLTEPEKEHRQSQRQEEREGGEQGQGEGPKQILEGSQVAVRVIVDHQSSGVWCHLTKTQTD